MKKSFAVLITLHLGLSQLSAQTPAPTPETASSPKEKEDMSLLERIFAPLPPKPQRPPAVAPSPPPDAASPTPSQRTETSRKRAATGRTAATKQEPEKAPTPKPTPAAKKEDESRPAKPTPSELEQPVPFVPTPSPPKKEEKIGGPVPLTPEEDAAQRERYREVRAKALEDSKVQQLREKFQTTEDPASKRKAANTYYKALFEKMRSIDSSLKDRINRMEAATLRRLDRRLDREEE